MADRPEMFAPTRGFMGMVDSMKPYSVVGPTIVAMATTFRLGAEIQSPTGLSVCLSVTPLHIASSSLFLDGIESFWPSVLHVALYKTLFLRFLI